MVPAAGLALIAPRPNGTTSFDLQAAVNLPPAAPAGFTLSVLAGFGPNGGGAAGAAVVVSVSVGAPAAAAPHHRPVNISAESAGAAPHGPTAPASSSGRSSMSSSMSFELPAGAASFGLRVLADRTLVEVFAAGGLAVLTAPVTNPRRRRRRPRVSSSWPSCVPWWAALVAKRCTRNPSGLRAATRS